MIPETGLPVDTNSPDCRPVTTIIVPPDELDLAKRLSHLFTGYEHFHGSFEITVQRANGKSEGTAYTLPGPTTPELWRAHLSGSRGLGAIPMRTNGTCQFGAVDVDIYDIDPGRIASQLQSWNVPAIAARSKSGGVHVYLWCN